MSFWIVTDACCDLPVDYIKKQRNLHIVPMSYQIGGKVQEIDLTDDTLAGRVQTFYDQLEDGAVATTFQVNQQEWIDHATPILEQGNDVLMLVFSSSLSGMRNVQLWLCGRGDMEAEINAVSKRADHIRYFGFVPQQAALYLQARAEVLINPRSSQGVFTRYSFPSKTLEYMRAGKPVICCKLEGIPDEYDSYLHYIAPQNAEGIQAAVMHVLSMPVAARLDMGARNRAFAINQKSSRFQGKRLYAFLRNVTDPA